MKAPAKSWACVAVAVLALAGRAAAREGEFTPETRAKLAKLVSIEEEAVSLAELAEQIAGQTGLAFVASAHVAHMPEPVAVIARDVPAGELLDAIAFSMDLDVMITPGGVVAVRLDPDDPRREAMIEREFGNDEGRGDEEGEDEPELDEDEIVERVMDNPKVRGVVEKLGGRLAPGRYYPEKRVWVLVVRGRDGEGPPRAHVVATEDGDVVDIKTHDKKRKGKHRDKERDEDEPHLGDDEARERLEKF